MADNGRSMRLSQLDSPPELTQEVLDKLRANQTSETVDVAVGGKTIKIHREQVSPLQGEPRYDVIFLHSGVFSSAVWVETQTLYQLANWGCRAVAIDLPGKGKSPESVEEQYWEDFLGATVSALGLNKLVVVSPSSGGKYAIPYLFKNSVPAEVAGFVPIAPHKTNVFSQKYSDIQLPTLIVYGTKDPKGPETLNDLMGLPNHHIAALEGAGHPCYKDSADDFHKVLYNWLKDLPK